MHLTLQPRQPARISGGVEPRFWGRDHLELCPVFGGSAGCGAANVVCKKQSANLYIHKRVANNNQQIILIINVCFVALL